MISMNGKNTTGWLTVLLIILNLALLVTLWYKHITATATEATDPFNADAVAKTTIPQTTDGTPPTPQQPEHTPQFQSHQFKPNLQLAAFLKRELKFSDQQVARFQELRKNHFYESETNRYQVDELRRKMMNQLLADPPNRELADQYADAMGEKIAAHEKAVFTHFISLMNLCSPQQKMKYKILIGEILQQLKPEHHKRRQADLPPPPDERNAAHPPQHPTAVPGPPQNSNRITQHINHLQSTLNLSSNQREAIEAILTDTQNQLHAIGGDSRYNSHNLRRQAAEKALKKQDTDIKALLNDQQKIAYEKIALQINKHREPPPQ